MCFNFNASRRRGDFRVPETPGRLRRCTSRLPASKFPPRGEMLGSGSVSGYITGCSPAAWPVKVGASLSPMFSCDAAAAAAAVEMTRLN